MATLSSVIFQQGALNPAGTKTRIYFALHSDILTFPTLPTTGTFAQVATIDNPYIMKPTKRFWEIYVTLEKGKADVKLVGERDGRSFETILSGMYPDLDAMILGLMKTIANENVAVIWEDQKGRLWTIGFDSEVPAELVVGEATSGEKIADSKGMKLDFRGIGDAIYAYDAAIPLTPAA
jgi:hypothetical protein